MVPHIYLALGFIITFSFSYWKICLEFSMQYSNLNCHISFCITSLCLSHWLFTVLFWMLSPFCFPLYLFHSVYLTCLLIFWQIITLLPLLFMCLPPACLVWTLALLWSWICVWSSKLYCSTDSDIIKGALFHYIFFSGFFLEFMIFLTLLTFLYPYANHGSSMYPTTTCRSSWLGFKSFQSDIALPLISSLQTNFDRFPRRLVKQAWGCFWLQFPPTPLLDNSQ